VNFVVPLTCCICEIPYNRILTHANDDLIVIGSGPALGPVRGDEIAFVGAAVNVGAGAKPPIPANA